MEYLVTVQIAGEDVPCGTLFQNIRHGQEAVSFSYSESYLHNPRAFALSPDLPLGAGAFHSRGMHDLRAFADCMPDRWGRNLLLREERVKAREESRTQRALFETDFLTGVSDETRQGALRIWSASGTVALSPAGSGVPREVSIPHLLEASDVAARDLAADVRDLIEAGSSLGGARPKASVRDGQGELCIAKFPKADESLLDDTCAWESVALHLMGDCGLAVPDAKLLRIAGRSVLVLRRFDRHGELRIPYLSGMSAVEGEDGGRYCYIELAEFIEQYSVRPEEDLPELWKRALFSCAVGNTDNHLRNYGFLLAGGGWRLSPAFDVNPAVGTGEKYLETALDFDRYEADPQLALSVAGYFRVTEAEARRAATDMAGRLARWQRYAQAAGISPGSVERMAPTFTHGIEALKKAAASGA